MTLIEQFMPLLPVPWVPHGYQKKAMRFLLEHSCAILLLDPGLGKTSITLGALKVLKKKKVFTRALLVAPLRVCYSVWPNEQQKWSDFENMKVEILHGKNKEFLLQQLLKPTVAQLADVYLINPEGLDWLLDVKKGKTATGKTTVTANVSRFKKLGFDTLIIDELSKFKHTGSGRFKALKQVHHLFARRWGLTGSPAPNGLLDLFGQFFIIDQGRSLGPYVTHYKMQYFLPGFDGFSWILREGAEQEIYERIAPLALRMAGEDYLELPTLVPNPIYLDMPDDVMEFYLNLEEELIAKLDDKVVTAATAAAASVKCRQVANGGIYLQDASPDLVKKAKTKREWLNLHYAKVDALGDLIDELQGSPLLVAYDFEHDLDRLREKLGKDLPYIGGGVTPKRSKELEAQWNAGKLPVLLGHPQSIAHGLNLQEVGNHIAWHSLTWDYELYDQFIRRVRRQGNKHKKVFCHHLLMRGTIDEDMVIALGGKKRAQDALFEALKMIAKRRKR